MIHWAACFPEVSSSVSVLPGQAMAMPPTERRIVYLTWNNNQLVRLPDPADGEALLQGWLIWGHEVHTFQLCGESKARWLLGDSTALDQLSAAYRRSLPQAKPYTALFVTVVGRKTTAPQDGFGAAYPAGLSVRRFVNAWPSGRCTD